MAKKLVIVGGGYVGSELARAMDDHAEVTLVEPREAFTHVPVMIRAVVSPGLVDRAFFPYDRLLRRGRMLRVRATAIDTAGVTLDGGDRLDADAVVVATGSGHGPAFKPTGESVDSLRLANRALHDAVAAAGSLAVVGGGALGVELAGEIKAARPGLAVTLVSETALLPGYPDELGRALAQRLRMLGVELLEGLRAEGLADPRAPSAGPLRLSDGRSLAADVIIPALGARPDTALLDTLPGVRKGPDGRVLTDRWMRPSDAPTLFAAGDAADNGDPMTIVGASRQAAWLARALRGLLAGRRLDRTPAYAPWARPPILVPLGPHLGASILPVVGLVGNSTTRLVKGKDLFLPKYRRLFRTG